MKIMTFSSRCGKEILRDPINLAFGLGFPVVLLLMLNAMQSNIPVDMFRIETLAPGVSVFGLSFLTLFSATVVAKDRESSLIKRLYTAPMRPYGFIVGYALPIVIMSIGQSTVTYIVAIILGLPFSVNILFAIAMCAPISLFYIATGLLCGSIFGVKQVGGICGALFTNLSAWLSGVWFDLSLLGENFEKAAKLLPFVHAVKVEQMLIKGDINGVLTHIFVVLIYAVAIAICAVIAFLKQMKRE